MRATIDALRTASAVPAKQREDKVNPLVDAVCAHAYHHGLAREQLEAIVPLVTRRSHLDQTSVTNLIKNLYPAERVSSGIIVTIAAALGPGQTKPAAATQSALLKWIIAVIDVLEDATVLSKLYGVLFNLLDAMSLRTPLCHLLSLVTRRKHVRPFRIQQLLEMVRATGQDPALVGLLRVYKDYYPEIIVGNAASGRTSFASAAQDEWRQRLQAIQEAHAERNEQLHIPRHGFQVIRRGAKRAKASILPDVRTSYANEKSVTLEEINSADDLVKHLERIELPNQLLASLKDPLLQKYLILNPSNTATRRLELWLESFLREVLDAATSGVVLPEHCDELLDGMLNYTRATKVLFTTGQDFLRSFLPLWNGWVYSESLLGLLAFVPMQDFEEFKTSYLRPAETAVVSSGTPDAYDRIVDFYTSLVQNWNRATNQSDPESNETSSAANFTALTNHISTTILSILTSQPHTPLSTVTAIITYHMTLSSLSSALTPLTIPSAHTLYTLLFHPSLATLSQLTSLLATYKRAFEAELSSAENTTITSAANLPRAVTNAFNGYLMDVANLLWRSRGLTAQDPNAMACLCAPSVADALNSWLATLTPPLNTTTTTPEKYTLTSLFGLSYNPITAALALSAFQDMMGSNLSHDASEDRGDAPPLWEQHPPGPVTQRTLNRLSRAAAPNATNGNSKRPDTLNWKTYRVRVLEWLAARGAGGLRDFMFVTMKDLMREASTTSSMAHGGSGTGAGTAA
ncbi:Centromere protein Cenp-I [Macrophomina phaseolina MS6]|uniref:Centromere protein Cenp-I n=1 Tax=Macrophomina phaseolina (strain MS6) TaxID=1126212 RepID=K2RLZ2_MACPH|nr:Centromere protein Cenp-I [Macrophomina phaseolina MS6]